MGREGIEPSTLGLKSHHGLGTVDRIRSPCGIRATLHTLDTLQRGHRPPPRTPPSERDADRDRLRGLFTDDDT
jgi:hypothetical protein